MQKDDGGELGHIAVAAIVGGILGGVSAAINGGGVADVLSGAAVGAATGAIGATGLGFAAQALASGAVSGGAKAFTIVCESGGFEALKDKSNQAEIVKAAGYSMADSVLGAAASYLPTNKKLKVASRLIDKGKGKVTKSLYAVGRGAKKLYKYGISKYSKGMTMRNRYRFISSAIGSAVGFASSLWRKG